MNELKPCPFCGADDLYDTFREEPFFGSKEPIIFCNSCKAEFSMEDASPFVNIDEDYKWRKRKTVEAWNKRIITDCPTIYGYSARQLATFAAACSQARIKVEDLSELFGNVSTAVETVSRIINEQTERIITEYMKNPIPGKEPVNGFRGAHMEAPDDG